MRRSESDLVRLGGVGPPGEAHTPQRTPHRAGACDDLSPNDKVVPPKGLQLRGIKRQEVEIRLRRDSPYM